MEIAQQTTPPRYTTRHPIRYLLASLIALGPLTMSLYTPSMPAITEALATSEGLVQATIGIFLTMVAIGQLIYGPISDRHGRRLVLFVGFSIYVLASLACAMATTIEQLLVARAFQGLGASAGAVMSRAIIRDLYEKGDIAKMLSFIGMALAAAPAIGPLLGGQLETRLGWEANFLVLAAVGVSLLILVAKVLPETNLDRTREPFLSAYQTLIRNRCFLGYVGPVGAALGGIFSFHSVGPFVLIDELGVPPTLYGFYTVLSVSGYFIGSFISNRVAGEVHHDVLIKIGLSIGLVSGISMLSLGLTTSGGLITLTPLLFMAPCILWAFSAGLVLPNGATGAIQPFPRIAGSASALVGGIQIGAGAGMSFAIAKIGGFLPLTFGILTTTLVSIGIAFYLWGVVFNRATPGPPAPNSPNDGTRPDPIPTIE
ncbi:MAG: multidrug effflux MFS transporter [Alphaproteobacteria bacterium]|nr:multidrug effflux MFS transporter [Alphaproteobacteria bacterium SS10]